MRVYLSGPISGLDYCEAVNNFDKCEAWAKTTFWDCEIVNPMKLNKNERDWKKCMKKCLNVLIDCDAIVLQKNWKQSRGAQIERFIAKKMAMKVYFYEL
jgi:hypothetical protein